MNSLLLTLNPRFDTRYYRENGLDPKIYIALKGDGSGLKTTLTYERDKPGTNYTIGPKTIAMGISHFGMWRLGYAMGGTWLFLEDDCSFLEGWQEQFQIALHHLPSNWDILYVGSCCAEDYKIKDYGGNLWEVSQSLCSHAYMMSREGMEKMIAGNHMVCSPLDIAMQETPNLKRFAILPRLIEQGRTFIPR
jgi:hypothetical protein